MARRSREDAQNTRLAILESARKLFTSRGYKDTTIADICAETGLTKGALFHHFPSKDALFEEIWMDLEVSMDTAAREAAIRSRQENEDPFASFLAGCRVFLEHVSTPEFQQIVILDGPNVIGTAEWDKRDAALGLRNIGSALKLLAAEGLINEDDRYGLTVVLYGALQGIAQSLSRGTSRASADQMFTAFENLVRGAHKGVNA